MKPGPAAALAVALLASPAAVAQNWVPRHQLTHRADDTGALTFLAALRPPDVARHIALGVADHARHDIVPDLPMWDDAVSASIAEATARIDEADISLTPLAADGTSMLVLRGQLRTPVPLDRLAAVFGPRRRASSHTDNRHTGWSFAVEMGAPVAAIARGVVTWSGPIDGLGLVVVVDHGEGVHSVYAQLVERLVTRGAAVGAGQVVGYGGAMTSFGTRETYFELRVDGIPEDP
ncbi:MAG: peptidoglycan DD-metalloendopeptidase family protein, partial [Ilumatobacteraceae bacterium]